MCVDAIHFISWVLSQDSALKFISSGITFVGDSSLRGYAHQLFGAYEPSGERKLLKKLGWSALATHQFKRDNERCPVIGDGVVKFQGVGLDASS